MPKVQLWGYRCERCGYEWLPRKSEQQPRTCPSCRSPYWDRPRDKEISDEHRVKIAWKAPELDGKTVEYKLVRGRRTLKGDGRFSASDLGDGTIQIRISPLLPGDPDQVLTLVQAEAELIESHEGKYR